MSCPTIGSCEASGIYDQVAGHLQTGLIGSLSGGIWSDTAAPINSLSLGSFVDLYGISCPAIDSCVAVGQYMDQSLFTPALIETLAVPPVTGLRITTPSPLPSAKHGIPYPGVQLQATGGTTPYKWKKLSKLPKGLKLSSSTGVISGIPSLKLSPGVYSVTIEARDSAKPHLLATKTFTLTVN